MKIWKRLVPLILVLGMPAGGALAVQQDTRAIDIRRTPIVEAYERARDSVVNISATQRVVVNRWPRGLFFDRFEPGIINEHSVGSGFVIHEDGYVVTNAHVVASATELRVAFADGREFDASVVAFDRRRDLAVVRILGDGNHKAIPLGRSDDLMIGEQTIAVGNPVGLQNTVTTGIISALHREIRPHTDIALDDLIQTDASINPGNSGGPLLNILGEVIGVNTAVRTDAQNIGFAIPVDQLRDVLPDVLNAERLNKYQLGARISVTEPPRIIDVREGSPAERAGLKPGDVLTTVDNTPIQRGIDFYVELLGKKPGDPLTLKVERDGKTKQAQFTLDPIPRPDGLKLAREKLGLIVQNIDEKVARRLELRTDAGVMVVGVEPASPAANAGIQPGDVLVYLASYRVRDLDQVGTLLKGVKQGESVDVLVWRMGRRQTVLLEGTLYAR